MCDHPGLRPGNAVLVDRHDAGRPNIVAYVELRGAQRDAERLVRELAAKVRSVTPLSVDEWVFVRRGGIPRTPSGKTRRFQLRQRPPGDDDIVARVRSR
jgi:fatty-acyl-CoA synthase